MIGFEDWDLTLRDEVFHRLKSVSKPGTEYRLAGTDAEERAAHYIAEKMGELGLEVELQPVPVDGWKRIDGYLRCEDGYRAELYTYAGNTGGVAEGELIAIEDPLEGDVEGKIVLFLGDTYPSHLITMAILANRGARAIVLGKRSDKHHSHYHIANNESAGYIPLGVVRWGEVESLIERVGKHFELSIETEIFSSTGYNVIGTIGEGPEILVTAHHDAYYPGIVDNASGVAAILDLARAIRDSASLGDRFRYRFISYTAEEYGLRNQVFDYLVGSRHFFREMSRDPARPGRIVAMINFDVIGLRGEPIGIAYTPDLEESVLSTVNSLSIDSRNGYRLIDMPSIWLDMWPATLAGVSTVSFSQLGENEYHQYYYHTEGDTEELIGDQNYLETLETAYELINYLSRTRTPFRVSMILNRLSRTLREDWGPGQRSRYRRVVERLSELEGRLHQIEHLRNTSGGVRGYRRIMGVLRRDLYRLLYSYGLRFPTTLFPQPWGAILASIDRALEKGGGDAKEILKTYIGSAWPLHMGDEYLRDILDRLGRVEGMGLGQPRIYPDPDMLDTENLLDWLAVTRESYIEMLWNVLDSLEEIVKHYEEEARQSPSRETSP